MKKVYLIGAGPGDIGLLTVKAYNIIKQAEVVLYDRLVSKEIMNLIPMGAKLINVGKNVGNHIVPQDRINEILLDEGKLGNIVVRLKGGDPFVFGRGGEELELLSKNNIPFEVVPGITSSIAVPSYAGIPVTHRDFCSSLHIITGHAKKGSSLSLDYEALVRLNGTLIFMMSVSNAGEIMTGLINANMDKKMPCAIIENGTHKNQRKFVSTIDSIDNTIKENNVISPAVIIVGKVCSLSEDFDWFSKLPLKGKKIIITNNFAGESELFNDLSNLGADCYYYPCIKTIKKESISTDINNYNKIIFTSAIGVKIFFDEFLLSNDIRAVYNKKFLCVGNKTADKLKEFGIIADFVPSIFDGETLANEAIKNNIIDENDNILLLRAENAQNDITNIFDENNIKYYDEKIYDTVEIEHNSIDINDYSFVTFASKSAIDGFANNNQGKDFSKITAVCIGDKTEQLAIKYGFKTLVSKEKTIDSMICLLEESI